MKYINKGAIISACGKYRYSLWREWRLHPKPAKWRWFKNADGTPVTDGKGFPYGEPKVCVFVMLNPSTADGETDDATIRRCVGFAQSWQYDRVEIINLFAYRATNPQDILKMDHRGDPVGWENQEYVNRAMQDADLVVCAWGAHGSHIGQDETMIGWLGPRKLYALKITKNGHPAHPLYLPANSQLVRFEK